MARGPNTVEPATPHLEPEENSRHGRLAFRPQPPIAPSTRTGLRILDGSDGTQLGLAYVPRLLDDNPFRLVLLLHGSGGSARQGIELMLPIADCHRLLLVAPKSRLSTWDVIMHGYGPDVRRIDRLLDEVSAAWPVNRLAVGGFSDGASYALSLGIANGDLFTHVLAFSPGFIAPPGQAGAPRLFISHGTRDRVLPIDYCSRRFIPALRRAGYDVLYQEFDGPHTTPPEIAQQAIAWFVGSAE